MRPTLQMVLLFAALASRAGPVAAAGRTVAVLEFRAGVRAAPRVSTEMAEQLGQLTSHRVIDPSEARRRLGSGLQAEIAGCKGDASCVAALGRRLGAQEVILVGLSQLGDLILAIQRIDAASGQVLARMADSLSSRRRIDKARLIQYLRRLLPPDDFLRYGTIVIRSDRPGDQVLLGDSVVGLTPVEPMRVPAPARYTLRVRRRLHNDFVTRFDVLPDASVEITPTLALRAREKPRWYERWWVWAVVGTVAVGTATALVILGRQDPQSVPAVVRF